MNIDTLALIIQIGAPYGMYICYRVEFAQWMNWCQPSDISPKFAVKMNEQCNIYKIVRFPGLCVPY